MLDDIWTLVGRLNRGATDRNGYRFDLPEKGRTQHTLVRHLGRPLQRGLDGHIPHGSAHAIRSDDARVAAGWRPTTEARV